MLFRTGKNESCRNELHITAQCRLNPFFGIVADLLKLVYGNDRAPFMLREISEYLFQRPFWLDIRNFKG